MKMTHATDVLFLGRGLTAFPIALEGALKLKEISYAHAEGYAAGGDEARAHRPHRRRACRWWSSAPKDSHYDKTLGNVQEVRARDGTGHRAGHQG